MIALYARCSTIGKGQDVTTQTLPLMEYAQRRGSEYELYVDEGISGSKDRRPALDRLMRDARLRKFDAVVVVRFDRFARSVRHLHSALEEFNSLGIGFVSLAESFDTSTPTGKLLFTLLAAIAEFERALIIDRIHSGLARARAQGKRLGPSPKIFDREKVKSVYQSIQSLRKTAEHFGLSKDTVARVVREV